MQSIYEQVTVKIVAELEAGVVPWVKPWTSKGGNTDIPVNAATGRRYSGVNVLLLWGAAIDKGYTVGKWLTYLQARGLGGQVRKGEHAEHIVFASHVEKHDADGELEQRYRLLKFYAVFNVAQMDSLPAGACSSAPARPIDEALAGAERFITTLGATIHHGSSKAAYSRQADAILLPLRESFETDAHYIATALHEHAHWTGHKSRLDRDLNGRFADQAYAAEELIAELTAAFLCAHLSVPGKLRHPEYIAAWLDVLKSDQQAIFTAAARATEAADYLRRIGEPQEQSEDDSN